jgi:hypothetical protein
MFRPLKGHLQMFVKYAIDFKLINKNTGGARGSVVG